jgi:DNA-binding FadR family transcriptional regulator
VAALRACDPEWAESVMRSHLRSARASLLGLSSHPDVPTRGE